MGVRNKNSTPYVHPDEPNLLDLHKAMEYRDGVPHVRVNLGSDSITITGDVNILDNIRINNTAEQAIPIYFPEVPTVDANVTFPDIYKVSKNTNDNAQGNPIFVNVTNGISEVSLSPSTLTALETITVSGTVALDTATLTALETINVNATQTGTWTVGLSQASLDALENTSVTITGTPTVNIGTNGTVSLSQTTLDALETVTVNQGTTPWVTSATITGGNIDGIVSYKDTIQMDPNDRLRVSVIGQQWWYVPSIDKDGDLRIQEAFQGANASSTFIQNLASVRMTSGLYYSSDKTLTGSAIRASRRRHKTRPGVGAEWLGTINWDGLQANVVKRIGLFTTYNGIFFEARSDGIYAVVRRRLTDGTLVENATKHTAWNLDPMDGTGPSGYNWQLPSIQANVTSVYSKATVAISGDGNVYQVIYQMPAGQESIIPVGKKVTLTGLNPTTFNDTGLVTAIDTVNHRVTVAYIVDPGVYVSASSAKMTNTEFHAMHTYWFDFNGSRTSRVRFGMLTDAGKVAVHEFTAGEIGTQIFSAPALMDRKEIVNVGQPVDFLPSMTVGGSAVTIETSADINPGFGVARTTTATTFNKNSQVGSEFAVIGVGIRIGEPYQRADLQVNKLQMVDLGNLNPQNAGIFQWRLVLNPTTSNAPTYTDVGKCTHRLTYAQGTTVTGGIDLIDGYAQGTFTGDVSTALNFLNMGSNISYTDSDIVVLAVKMLVGGTDNSSVQATINYSEDL